MHIHTSKQISDIVICLSLDVSYYNVAKFISTFTTVLAQA